MQLIKYEVKEEPLTSSFRGINYVEKHNILARADGVNQTMSHLDVGTTGTVPVKSRSFFNDKHEIVDIIIPQPLVKAGVYVVQVEYLVSCIGLEERKELEWYHVEILDNFSVSSSINTRQPFNLLEKGTAQDLILQKLRVTHYKIRSLKWWQHCFVDPITVETRELVIAPGFVHYDLSMHERTEAATSLTISQINSWFSIWNYPTNNSNIVDDTLNYIGMVCKDRIIRNERFFKLARPLMFSTINNNKLNS